MKRTVFLLTFLFLITFSIFPQVTRNSKKANPSAPDFAFPVQVKTSATEMLRSALDGGDDFKAVEAALHLCIAESAISSDSVASVLNLLRTTRAAVQASAAKSLLALLEANIIHDYYQSDRWTIDRRPALDCTGDDITTWAKPNFRNSIVRLTAEALQPQEALLEQPIANLPQIIQSDKTQQLFFPTLYDFASALAVNLLSPFATSNVLNPALMERLTDDSLYPLSDGISTDGDILRIYRHWVLAEGVNAGPRAYAYASMLQFVNANTFGIDESSDPETPTLFSAAMKLYRQLQPSEYAVEVLLANLQRVDDAVNRAQLYHTLCDYRDAHPGYLNIDGVNALIEMLDHHSVRLSFPEVVAPEQPFTIKVESENVNALQVTIYDISASFPSTKNDNSSRLTEAMLRHPVATIPCTLTGEIPFSTSELLTAKLPGYGVYLLLPSFEGRTPKPGDRYDIVRCTDLTMSCVSGGGNMLLTAVDVTTGAPVEDVQVMHSEWRNQNITELLPGTTDAEGFTEPKGLSNGEVQPRKGKDRYADWISSYNYREAGYKTVMQAKVFTSLNLYHPGDTLQFAVVAYTSEKSTNAPVPGAKLIAVFRDANYEEVQTVALETDLTGRASGSFVIPASGLTGNYHIIIRGEYSNEIASRAVMVSDYKLPTFEVTAELEKRPATIADDAVVSGTAMTFANFPVANAQVELTLAVRTGFWWWATESPSFFKMTTVTDEAGHFRCVIPADVIAASPCPRGYFLAGISVTSPDGETHETSTGFNLGRPYAITVNVAEIITHGNPAGFSAAVLDAAQKPASTLPLRYSITGDSETFAEGETTQQEIGRIVGNLPAGTYTVRLALTDPELALPVTRDVIVYDPKSTVCPVDRLLWFPQKSLTADAAGKVTIALGTAYDDTNILMLLSDSNGKVVRRQWLRCHKGMNRVEVELPDASLPASALFMTVKNGNAMHELITLNPASYNDAISLAFTTFRDKVVPGDQETVTLQITTAGNAQAASAVMLDMSNKAIELLSPNPWELYVSRLRGTKPWMHGLDFGYVYCNLSALWKLRNTIQISAPEFETYGYPLYDKFFGCDFGMRMLSVSNFKQCRANGMDDSDEFASVVPCASAAPSGSMADETMEEEADAAEETASDQTTDAAQTESYRPSEVPLAFFRPDLTTDGEGHLSITYTVPDANTTWVLKALAFNAQMLTASAQTSIVASKKLMVSTNAPRFMRNGDSAVLRASVMNASEETLAVTTVSELLDALTGQLIATEIATDSIAPGARAVVSLPFHAEGSLAGVIYRVRATAKGFSDGEQVAIPLLPSSQDVVESQMFYLAPNQANFRMSIPATGDEGRAYLHFTENPTWQVVSALPGLRENKINSSLEAASALFSAAVARGLMTNYPEIVRALRRWKENPTDSALVSALEKNSELKQMLLSATPWVAEAQSQTQRMQRLVMLLDGANISSTIENAVANLSRTFAPGGGWYWTAAYPYVSDWCTSEILDMMGDLNRLGWLPDNKKLSQMLEASVKYIDKEAAETFAKYPKTDFTLYCYSRWKFPDVKLSTAAKRVVDATTSRIIASWKEHSTTIKAADAIILEANGYHATACNILESVRQHATSTPEKGMWWNNLPRLSFLSLDAVGQTAIILDAFHMVEPGSPDIDRIRQWLILQKANLDWGNAVITSQVVSSILISGSRWTVNPAATAIRVNDRLIANPSTESYIGEFTAQISKESARGATLEIDRQANYPSFGAVVTMRTLPMDEVKAVGCSELTVEKSLSVFNGTEWKTSETFNVGDRVMVSLLIKARTSMDNVVIEDLRAASFEPVEQLPTPIIAEGLYFYRENRDSQTNIFIDRLPKGTYLLTYELFATQSGTFASGCAQMQSLYNPNIAAHSAGAEISVSDK